jgi:hypothetical protein
MKIFLEISEIADEALLLCFKELLTEAVSFLLIY